MTTSARSAVTVAGASEAIGAPLAGHERHVFPLPDRTDQDWGPRPTRWVGLAIKTTTRYKPLFSMGRTIPTL